MTRKGSIRINYKVSFFQFTPMHWAVFKGHTEIVKILAQNKVDLNVKDRWQVNKC